MNHFIDIQNNENTQSEIPVPVLNKSEIVKIEKNDASQAQIIQGWHVPTIHDKDYAAIMVMNTMLGASGLSSRLFLELREKKGLAYTDRVLQLTKEQDIDNKIESDYLEKAVSKIVVDADGTITVRFINGSEIKDREENNAGTSEKNRNKNRRQSVTCKAK